MLMPITIHARFRKKVRYFDSDPNINVSKEIGKYHQNKKNWKEAIRYYELANEKSTAVDIETNLLLLQAYAETQQFELKANELLELFPAQPQFYFYSGLGYNQLKQ
jgi:cellulose biosynthesis protein BcsQ